MSTAGCPKAKNAANQRLVECLFVKRNSMPPTQPGRRNHFAHSIKSAEDSIRKMKEPIENYKQALAVKGVGPKIAHILFADGQDEIAAAAAAKRKQDRATASSMPDSPASSAASSSSIATKRRRKENGDSSKCSAKVRAYEKALADAQTWKAQSARLVWKVVLIVDEREREKSQMESKCLMAKIPCERRTLPIGDMAWIAQAYDKNDRLEKTVVELMLGTIIERKSISDLIQSIKGSRYVEQRMRMKESGLPQLLFLVEGDLHKESRNTREFKMCYTAMYETRMHLGFQIVQTGNMTETVQMLKRLHRRILKRTFPSAFYAEALPFFSGPDLDHRRRQQSSSSSQQTSSSSSSSTERAPAVRHRRKNDSLQEMRFDVEPEPFGDMERFITYPEFKAKVEMGRENASRSVAMIHAAMLKQVPRIENKKIQAIMNAYPTPHSLFSAYHELETEREKKELVSLLSLSDSTSAKQLFVGQKSSVNLYTAYGMTRDASQRLSYEELTQRVRSGQDSTSVACSQEAEVGMSQEPLSVTGQSFVMKTTKQNKAASSDESARLPAVQVPTLPFDRTKQTMECIDILSSDDEMNKKPAARLSPLKTNVNAIATQRTKHADELQNDELDDNKFSPAKAYATKEQSPKQELKGDYTADDDDDDIGSDYDYSPLKAQVNTKEQLPKENLKGDSTVNNDDDDDIGSDYDYSPLQAHVNKHPPLPRDKSATKKLYENKRASKPAKRQGLLSVLDSSDDDDDDYDNGSSLKKAPLADTKCAVPLASNTAKEAQRKTAAKPSSTIKRGVLSVGDSSDEEDENALPVKSANNNSSKRSLFPAMKKQSQEVLDLLDDD
ncbi:hypothetical protein MPSEU_000701100 [Mayamaea pseudoterrestris]|nr:hypothetical protein MPSEU_000701100 [Mayamaea pseudoterrestris]